MVVPAVGASSTSCEGFRGFCRLWITSARFARETGGSTGATLGLVARCVRYAVAMTLRIRYFRPGRLWSSSRLSPCGLSRRVRSRASLSRSIPAAAPRRNDRDGRSRATSKVALVDVRGVIVDARQRGLMTPPATGRPNSSPRLEKGRHDPAVKARRPAGQLPGASRRRTSCTEGPPIPGGHGQTVVVSMGARSRPAEVLPRALAGDAIVLNPPPSPARFGVIIPRSAFRGPQPHRDRFAFDQRLAKTKDLANPLWNHAGGNTPSPAHGRRFLRRGSSSLGARPARVGRTGATTRVETAPRWLSRCFLVASRSSRGPRDAGLACKRTLLDGRVVGGEEAAALGLVGAAGDLRDAFQTPRETAFPAAGKCPTRTDGNTRRGDSVRSAYCQRGGDALVCRKPAGAGGRRSASAQLRHGR